VKRTSEVWFSLDRRMVGMVRTSLLATLLLAAPTLGFQPGLAVGAAKPVLSARRAAPLYTASPLVASAAAVPAEGGGVGMAPSIINLAKNIVGSGVLALAAGVAAFSGARIAIVPSLAVLLFIGALSAYTFSIIARVGDKVGASTYRDTWAKVFGTKTVFLPDLTVVFMTACAALCYAIIIGDSFAGIATLAGAPALLQKPNAWIILLSAFLLLPLALLRDLSSLAIGSVIGTAGTLYTALFMALRAVDGTYAPGGKFHLAISEASRPAFAAAGAAPLMNTRVFVLISMLASAFLAHYNAPKFYQELTPPADGSSKLPRWNLVCAAAFGGAAALMGGIMAAGYLTFGSAAQGLILNNYATSDTLAFVARVGIGASIIFSYPLNFVGLREGVLGMFGAQEAGKKNVVHVALTVGLLCLMNGAALFMKDLGLVVGLGGAILGSALVYIFPALMAIGEDKGAVPSRVEKAANYGLAALGVFFAGLGAVMCLKGA